MADALLAEARKPAGKPKRKTPSPKKPRRKRRRSSPRRPMRASPGVIEKGKKAGRLTSKELLEVLEDMNLSTDQVDKFNRHSERTWGIDTVGEITCPPSTRGPCRSWRSSARSRGYEEEIIDTESMVESFSTDDPVSPCTSRRSARCPCSPTRRSWSWPSAWPKGTRSQAAAWPRPTSGWW
jgi:hypothetical protein